MAERNEAWMRIIIGIVSGIILGLWKALIIAVTIFHWFYVIFTEKRSAGLADFCNLWITQAYRYLRYMTFVTNSRPFPFSELGQPLHPAEMKTKK